MWWADNFQPCLSTYMEFKGSVRCMRTPITPGSNAGLRPSSVWYVYPTILVHVRYVQNQIVLWEAHWVLTCVTVAVFLWWKVVEEVQCHLTHRRRSQSQDVSVSWMMIWKTTCTHTWELLCGWSEMLTPRHVFAPCAPIGVRLQVSYWKSPDCAVLCVTLVSCDLLVCLAELL